LLENYFQNAAIPALNRISSRNVGVFKELKPEGQTKIYVLIPFASIEDYLNAPAKEPAYERIQSSLLKAFAHMPKLEVPPNKPRIFELRRYESASEAAGKMKIEMF